MDDPQGKLALLAGASEFTRTYAVTRRPLGREHPRLANRIVQFERLEAQLKGLSAHTAFCCLGASDEDARDPASLRALELEGVLAFARAARAAGVQRFVHLSCAAADARSKDARMRYKAEVERGLEALGFASLDILQPGPLLGMRRHVRLADLGRMLIMPLINPMLTGAREPRRAISATAVAAAMLGAARSGRRGVYRYTYASLRALPTARPQAAPKPSGSASLAKPGRPPG